MAVGARILQLRRFRVSRRAEAGAWQAEPGLGGDLAFRYGWGASPVFALSVGGFHPSYQPPAGFPALRRITIAIGHPGAKALIRERYAKYSPESRNERGTIVFLLGRNLTS